MNCDQAIELLPWLLNGTLEAGEREEVRQHLETCSRCREALADTRESWRILDQHLPTETLVALADGETPPDLDPALIERHLLSCPQCAAELEMVNTSRRLVEDEKIVIFSGKLRRQQQETGAYRSWRATALAASLAGLVAVSGWVHSARQTQQLAEVGPPPRLESSVDVNVPPDEEMRDQAPSPIIEIPSGGRLHLGPSYAGHYSEFEIEVHDDHGRVLSTASGIQRDPNGYYTPLTFKESWKPGVYRLQVLGVAGGHREPLETYSIHIMP